MWEKSIRATRHPVFVAFLMLSVYFLCASLEPAQAKLFKWKDDKGATHYTDNENNIPRKYRTKDKIEKFKGLSKPKTIKSDPPEEEEAEGGETGPEDEVEGEEGASEIDAETLALLNEVKTFLNTEIKMHKRMLKAIPPTVK